jgi:hypothetical protein
MKLNTKLALLLLAGTAGYMAFQNLDLLRFGAAKDEDPALLFNRIWMESKPEKPTDYVHGAYFLSRPQLGIFQRSSAYDFHFERFDYKRDGTKMTLKFPQQDRSSDLTLHITKCTAPEPFDLCLDLGENPWGGPKRYYGMSGQEDEQAKALGPAAASIRSHLPAE